jgi:hypothetical protein
MTMNLPSKHSEDPDVLTGTPIALSRKVAPKEGSRFPG